MWEVAIDPTLLEFARLLADGTLMKRAINAGLTVMYPAVYEAASQHSESGTMLAALSKIDFATGPTSGGIGDLEKVGDPFQEAPKHTISDFVKWYKG